eukprot:TRINITY_DN52103_c0_g1_i1.p2 TRINITY_DN52103_c0_g1~~TRINITY_DN52103_c0_g1_i1.p2  ORF type:complete len:147 (-),score=25.17 TRINITY_DN52103_c0_g1_i1:264-704(-)
MARDIERWLTEEVKRGTGSLDVVRTFSHLVPDYIEVYAKAPERVKILAGISVFFQISAELELRGLDESVAAEWAGKFFATYAAGVELSEESVREEIDLLGRGRPEDPKAKASVVFKSFEHGIRDYWGCGGEPLKRTGQPCKWGDKG